MTHPLSIEPNDDWVCDLWWGEGEEEEDQTPNCPKCRDATDMAFNPESGKWECGYYKCQ
jgi:ribosomal protein S27AE